MNVTVIPIPSTSRALLATAPGWQETQVPAGKRIARHYHNSQAYYYTFGVPKMQVGHHEVGLPEAAMVVVAQGVAHGWIGPDREVDAAVGHFHDGHGKHKTLAVVD